MDYHLPRYEPSGALRPISIAFFLAAALAACAAAIVYQLLLHYVPYMVLSIFVVLGAGWLLATASAWCVRTGHLRHRGVAVLLSALLALVALAASYYVDYRSGLARMAAAGATADQLAATTLDVWLRARIHAGWSIDSHGSLSQFDGPYAVGLLWLIEAGTLVGFAVAGALEVASVPYCEKCERWTSGLRIVVPGRARADVDAHLRAGDLTSVAGLAPPESADNQIGIELLARVCEQCKETAFLDVSELRIVKKRRVETKTTKLVRAATLGAEARAKLLERFNQLVVKKEPTIAA